MNNWSESIGMFQPHKGSAAFSTNNIPLAKYLCNEGKYDGWSFPLDQTQVMLCKPMSCLKLVKVLEIQLPYGPIETIMNNNNRLIYSLKPGHKFRLGKPNSKVIMKPPSTHPKHMNINLRNLFSISILGKRKTML